MREILKGWTPEAHGVFTDNLTRARRQLAASFESSGAGLTPVAGGTDIFGALWRLKTLMDSDRQVGSGGTHEIWIFSDMINETPALMMPALVGSGPRKMLEQAKANGLLVPLRGYRIHVSGASMRGLSPQAWNMGEGLLVGVFPGKRCRIGVLRPGHIGTAVINFELSSRWAV